MVLFFSNVTGQLQGEEGPKLTKLWRSWVWSFTVAHLTERWIRWLWTIVGTPNHCMIQDMMGKNITTLYCHPAMFPCQFRYENHSCFVSLDFLLYFMSSISGFSLVLWYLNIYQNYTFCLTSYKSLRNSSPNIVFQL